MEFDEQGRRIRNVPAHKSSLTDTDRKFQQNYRSGHRHCVECRREFADADYLTSPANAINTSWEKDTAISRLDHNVRHEICPDCYVRGLPSRVVGRKKGFDERGFYVGDKN